MSAGTMQPKYPIYIPSYQRWQDNRRLTIPALERIDVPYHVIVEPEEEKHYREKIDESIGTVLVLPQEYKDEYVTYIDTDAPLGAGPARNYGLDHARENGHDWYWCIDDNISHFLRSHQNDNIRLRDGSGFAGVEDFVARYDNVAMAGMNYEGWQIKRSPNPPINFNTRIYSCNLLQTDIGYRWEGRYNEDTDLSLRMLKDGWSTILCNAFLAAKRATQSVDGGNTDTVYADKSVYDPMGTYEKTKALKRRHPSVTRIVRKWDRWHHEVDYSPFESNDPQLKDDPPEPRAEYNYTMHDPR